MNSEVFPKSFSQTYGAVCKKEMTMSSDPRNYLPGCKHPNAQHDANGRECHAAARRFKAPTHRECL